MVSIAYAAGTGSAPAGSPLGGLIPMILIIAVFYFLVFRPQQKKAKEQRAEQQAFLDGLKKGEAVVTSGGLHGVIKGLTDKVVTMEIADNVKVKISRANILCPVSALKKDENCKSGS